ncbi:MAG: hypothetical protein D6806_02335 [Deltaproteobacteria bacterium]|nr:MAG: hypothetical protein D6806_02335 [Deltaproteobacteria bacterium]
MEWIFVAVAGIVLIVVMLKVTSPGLGKAVDRAVQQDDITPIVEAVEKKPEAERPSAYNHAIRMLWNTYHRGLAAKLIRHLAQKHVEVPIAQYWLKQIMQVEPRLAKQELGDDFLHRHYMPEVAASCGPVG